MKDILPELNNKDYIENLANDYDIHFCYKNEVEELIEFIDTYWKKNHIFVLSRKLLDWQHYDSKNNRYNFVIAKHKKSRKIHSVLGFIPTSQFDNEISNVAVWPCIWRSRDDVDRKGLGVSLYHYMKTHLKITTLATLGITESTLAIYKKWGFSTGKCEHYYYPNMNHAELLSFNRQSCNHIIKESESWTLRELSLEEYNEIDFNDETFKATSKYKSKKYYINRYYNHPIYKYCFLAMKRNNIIYSIIIARECGNAHSTCLRIVDYIGDINNLYKVKYNLQKFMIEKNYEYIDFINVGISSNLIERAGFVNRKYNSTTIIPNYFEPFLKENIDLIYAFKSIDSNCKALFFKADSDQDRPSIL